MIASHQRVLVMLLFLSACGTWLSWLSLGPLLLSNTSALAAFGGLALIRQFFSFLGTLVGEVYSSKIERVRFNVLIEAGLILVNLLAFLGIFFSGLDVDVLTVLVWASVRYFLGGLTVASVYRLLSEVGNQSSSVVLQLGVSQGSVLVGAALTLAISQIDIRTGALIALSLDIFSSFLLFVYLSRLRLSEISSDSNPNLWERVKSASTSLFGEVEKVVAFGFIFAVLSISGLPTTFLYFSAKSDSVLGSYGALNMVNGAFLLLVSALAGRNGFRLNVVRIFGFAVIVFALGTVLLFEFSSWRFGLAAISLAAVTILISSHYIVIERVEARRTFAVRSSMALVLTLVFGVSELIMAKLFESNQVRAVLFSKVYFAALAFVCFQRSRCG